MVLAATAVAFVANFHAHSAAPDSVFAENGVVVSATDFASQAGVDILRDGGNAVDAAVATGFVLAVTHPQAGNIGGGGFMVVRTADGTVFTLDYREKAPAKAHRDMFLDANGEVSPGLSTESPLASGVPGSVDGLLKALEEHGSGKVTRKRVLEVAIRLAQRGFVLSHGLADDLNGDRGRFAKDPGAAEVFIRSDGRPWRAGDRFVQRDLAAALKRIAKQGRDGFYAGKTAELFADQMRETDGMITESDLAEYASVYREPVRGTFQGFEILSMGPPSSGGALVVQMLNMLEDQPLADYGWNSAAYIHLLTEAQRLAYADRAEHMGDPDFWRVPLDMLTSKAYAKGRASAIDMRRATLSDQVFAGGASARESEQTTHYSVVDAAGNAVAVTTTLNGGFGSGIVVKGAGFLLNNEMDDFSAKPGTPNMFGLVGNEANAVEPGKRMLSSMSPTIVVRDGKPYLVVGSPGGATIINTVLQVILNTTVHGLDILEAVSAPRHHSQWRPDQIVYEGFGISPDTIRLLEAMGHKVVRIRQMGQANCIMISDAGKFGAADPRGENAAVGY